MRVWGRVTNEDGTKTWVEVSTDPSGLNDAVNITWLAQALKLNLGESPFYGNWGIPAQQSVVTQIFPDFYVWKTQRRFAGLFGSLTVLRVPNLSTPTYQINLTTHVGAVVETEIAT